MKVESRKTNEGNVSRRVIICSKRRLEIVLDDSILYGIRDEEVPPERLK